MFLGFGVSGLRVFRLWGSLLLGFFVLWVLAFRVFRVCFFFFFLGVFFPFRFGFSRCVCVCFFFFFFSSRVCCFKGSVFSII